MSATVTVKFLKDKPQLVDVTASVEQVIKKLKDHNEVQLIAKQGEINRVGMIVKQVEQQAKCIIKSMKTSSGQDFITDQHGQKKKIKSLIFKVVFVKQ